MYSVKRRHQAPEITRSKRKGKMLSTPIFTLFNKKGTKNNQLGIGDFSPRLV
jgi:hypothetical protein